MTAEEFADRLDRQASKSKGKTGEVMINVDVIETILLETWLHHRLVCEGRELACECDTDLLHLRRIQARRRMANL